MEPSAAKCERTPWHAQEAQVSHLSVFSQPPPLCLWFFFFFCVLKTRDKVIPSPPHVSLQQPPSLHSYICKAPLQLYQTVSWELPCLQGLLVRRNCFPRHRSKRLLLFCAGRCSSSFRASHRPKINGHAFSSPRAPLSGRLSNRCPGITPSQWKDAGSVFVCEFAWLDRKCQVFLDEGCAETPNDWAV